MSSGSNILKQKLQGFVRKYHLNQLIKGGLIFTTIFVAIFLSISFLEHVGRFTTSARAVIFGTWVLSSAYIFWKYIFVSASKLLNWSKTISNEEAAVLIGEHFPDVKDKLLNTLELEQQITTTKNALIIASIEQKEQELSPIPFQQAIDFSSNKKMAQYAATPVFVLFLVLIISPAVITESTSRIVQFNQHFEVPAPFKFEVNDLPESAVQFSDVEISLRLTGDKIPNQCFVQLNGGPAFKMIHKGNNEFAYTIRNIDKTSELIFSAGGFKSRPYFISVSPKSVINEIKILANYPNYTGKENEEFKNNANLLVPEGTVIQIEIETESTQNLKGYYIENELAINQVSQGVFSLETVISELGELKFLASNNSTTFRDSSVIRVQPIKDQIPLISVQEFSDTLSSKLFYFKGMIDDDYGFSRLSFVYVKDGQKMQTPITIPVNSAKFEYYYTWDLALLPDSFLTPGSTLQYYFEIWDNDGVNGPKSARTFTKEFKVPSKEEIREKTDKQDEETKKDLESSIKEAQKLQEDIDKLNRKLLEKKNITWEEKKEIESLLNQQKQLQNQFKEIRKENEINNYRKSEFSQEDERILEKQKQLVELMEKVMDEETMKILEELQKLMEKNDKQQLQEKLDELKLDSEELEKELDRSLELFKQLEFERKLQESIDDIKQLKEEQEKLQKETEQAEENKDPKGEKAEELQKKQEQLNEKMKSLEEQLDKLNKQNKELDRPNEMPDLKQESQEAKNNMQNAKESLEQNKKKDAAKSQEQAKDKLDEMQQKMQAAQEKMQQEQAEEDLEALRRLRQNLMQLSFEQEELIENIKITNPRDPKYIDLTKEQMRLSDNSKMIQDSLFALSKRNMSIQTTVNKEISAINDNIEKAIRAMENRRSGEVMNRQQFVMTSINNLALILDESIQNAQKQQSSKKFGNKSCSKPGSGMPKMGDIKKLQKQLSDQLKQMQQQQQGKKPGQKPGDKLGKQGGRGSKAGESMAKMAAQQAAIREQLRKMSEELKNISGQGGGNQLKRLQDLMEKNEEDLVNMKIDQETINRQEEIMSRLLESEKAEREREYDNKRESKSAENKSTPPDVFLEYQLEKMKKVELLETIPPNLKPFYRNLVNEYFGTTEK